ncbi:MAG: rod-binding protein [Desulfobacterales bacterium]|jgi:Rod binding domain-containing protein|nr:rod-binding protein [Desulfobacterales bacterium]
MPGPIDRLTPAAAAGAARPPAAGRTPPSGGSPDPRLKSVCRDMEALFIHHMLSEMRKTVAKSGLLDGGRAEEVYTSLMDAEMAKHMAQSGSLGLSAMLMEQLSRRQAGAAAPADPVPAPAAARRTP